MCGLSTSPIILNNVYISSEYQPINNLWKWQLKLPVATSSIAGVPLSCHFNDSYKNCIKTDPPPLRYLAPLLWGTFCELSNNVNTPMQTLSNIKRSAHEGVVKLQSSLTVQSKSVGLGVDTKMTVQTPPTHRNSTVSTRRLRITFINHN